MKKDVKRLADSDPFLAALLGFKRYFFYADWKLFRAGESSKLAEKLIGKLRKGTLFFVVLLTLLVLFELKNFRKHLREDESYMIVCSALLLAFYAIFFTLGIVSTIRDKHKVEEILKTYGEEAQSPAAVRDAP